MKGIKNFITGFTLSLVSVSLSGQLYTSISANHQSFPHQPPIKIDLFKKKAPQALQKGMDILTPIQKEDFVQPLPENIVDTPSIEVSLNELENFPTPVKNVEKPLSRNDIVYSPEGMEDDEILSINVDDIIPIDFSTSPHATEAEFSNRAGDNLVATLPETMITEEEIYTPDDTWSVIKGNKYTKNKKIIEKYASSEEAANFINDFQNKKLQDKQISYQVAEKIKQSIIFPIPDEILNDENLTPTFVTKKLKSQHPFHTNQSAKSSSSMQNKTDGLKVTPRQQPSSSQASAQKDNGKGFLDSISSWFTDKASTSEQSKQKSAPSYSSQEEATRPTQATKQSVPSNAELLNFYETLQETKEEHYRKNIIPTELKLSFQPHRAEISGTTLRWLKTFSDASKNKQSYLQIRLDASTPIELQRKRLNLLYTIFMNNGVDFKKVDTAFSATEPNTFIIRVLKVKENQI